MPNESYSKLFSSITTSTIWCESDSTRLVWITMLAMADRNGYVGASIPGLASIARVDVEKCRAAIACFLSPDPDSRTQAHEGRRIEEADRGWNILNYDDFRKRLDAEAVKESKRLWWEKNRGKGATLEGEKSSLDELDETRHITDSDSDSNTSTSKSLRATVQQAAQDDDFNVFWEVYPVKKGKAKARSAWAKAKGKIKIDLLAKLEAQKTQDDEWLRGFAPHPATYLNGERWNDSITPPKPNGGFDVKPPKETLAARLTRKAISEQQGAIDRPERPDHAELVDSDVRLLLGKMGESMR